MLLFKIPVSVFLAVFLLASAVQADADPFYSSRLREGMAAAERGNHAEAAKMLRIACFGLLEEDGFADCLVRLGLSQAAVRDTVGFGQTFRRLVEAETLLGSVSRVGLDPGLEAAYRTRVKELIAESIWQGTLEFLELESTPTEVGLVATESAEGAPLSVRERRRLLQRGRKGAPEEAEWSRQLAALEREADRPKAAIEAATVALELVPGDSAASCSLGWGHGRLENCRAAVPYLNNCQEFDAELLQMSDRCTTELEAARAEEQASAQAREVPQVESMTGGGDDASVEASPSNGVSITGPGEAVDETGSASDLGPTVSREEALAELDAIGQQLTSAGRIDQLNDLFERVLNVLDVLPEDPSAHFLAAEIAYRASRWDDAVSHFMAGGDPGEDNPRLLFYLAIAQYESGDPAAAETTLLRCIDRLSVSPFVERYRAAILGD